ncbi:unnamed protein product, partial [Ectocarpus sp. 12 AP-2014]
MRGTMASPPSTANAPPGQKSFWTSITRRACMDGSPWSGLSPWRRRRRRSGQAQDEPVRQVSPNVANQGSGAAKESVMNQDETPMTTALAIRLVDRAMPEWAGLPVRPLSVTGTDNWMFRLGNDKVLRLPRRSSSVTQLEREWDWLGHLRGLPLGVPKPLALGHPDAGYPHPWMVLTWRPGEPLANRPPANALASAEALG